MVTALTLQGGAIIRFKAMVADRRVGLEVDVHRSLSGLKPGGNRNTTKLPQQRRARCGAIPDLEDGGNGQHHTVCGCYSVLNLKVK